jgi:putative ABC transport system permease protein
VTISRLLTHSLRSIMRNRVRSLLTSLGIIIGVGSVIVMVAVGEGSQAQISRQIASMGTNLIIVVPPRGPNQANRITRADVAKLKAEVGTVSAVSGEVRMSTKVVGGSGYRSTTVSGVEPDFLSIRQWNVKDGEFFTEADLKNRSKVAVIGRTVATKLFGDTSPIGESIRIQATPFKIIGVMAEKGSSGMGDDQDDCVIVPLDTAVTRLQKDRYLSAILLSASRADLMTAAQKEIQQVMRESHRLAAGDTADFDVMNQAEIIKTASQTSKSLTTLLAAIAGVSLLVGGIGIMNIMLVSVTERTREIGIRMSVGARRRDILLQFLTESVILSLIGGAIGIALAVGVAWFVQSFMGTPAIIKPGIIFESAGFAAAVGVFFGFYPARKAARLYPIDALRYE